MSPRGCINAVGSMALLLALSACDDHGGPAPARPATQASSAPAATDSQSDAGPGAAPAKAGEPRPGFVRGRVVNRSGNPVAGARISIGGTTIGNGERAHFQTSTRADGTYELRVPHGLYTVSGKVLAQFGGRSYLMPLHAADNSYDDADSDAGIFKDFVWQISGLKPGQTPGSTSPEHYYGAVLELRDRNSYEDRVGFSADGGPGTRPDGRRRVFPPGTVVTLTLAPDGPLIDGSKGETLTYRMEVTERMNYDYNWPKWYDLPVGRYTLAAEVAGPGGAKSRARVAAVSAFDGDKAKAPLPAQTAVVEFLPDTSQTYAGGTRSTTAYVIE